ncbi:MAG: diadenylate cyclase CdaA [Oscillospiraceae bacterium]|nr:diadenylate cyclase CdaA [Oscillospiraceae bacterium]
METITNALSRAGSYLTTIGISDFVDIIIVAFLIYWLIGFVRKSNFINLAKGVIMLLLALWLSEFFGLIMIKFILRKVVELGVIALVIIFQPELRRALERVGSSLNSLRSGTAGVMADCIDQTVRACMDMAATKPPTGALIVFERSVSLAAVISTGTIVNGDTSADLLMNLFFKNSPLHDGAVIIRDGRIEAAGCMLPLTGRTNLSRDLGMRHRAALGVCEESDALVVIVSEQSGAISVALNKGELKRHLSADELRKVLMENLIPEEKTDSRTNMKNWMKSLFTGAEIDNENENQKNI